MAKTFGVLSLKGGVGKTSVVSALGAALADFGKKVLLVDGNFSAPNLGLHLNLLEPKFTIHDVLEKKANPKDAIHTVFNFDVIPADLYKRGKTNCMKLRTKLGYLRKSYDVILIDSSPSLDEETLAVMNASDELIIVITPNHATLGTTLKTIKLAKQRGLPIAGLVLNKVHNKNFEVSLKDLEEVSDVPVLAVIPYDLNVLKSLSEFSPSTKHRPKSKASEEYKRLAATLIGEKYKPFKLRKFLNWISPPKEEVNRTVYYKRVFK